GEDAEPFAVVLHLELYVSARAGSVGRDYARDAARVFLMRDRAIEILVGPGFRAFRFGQKDESFADPRLDRMIRVGRRRGLNGVRFGIFRRGDILAFLRLRQGDDGKYCHESELKSDTGNLLHRDSLFWRLFSSTLCIHAALQTASVKRSELKLPLR